MAADSGRRLLGVLACLLLAGAGCSGDEDLAEATYGAQYEGISARVWIPINEARSVGSYRVEVKWSDGTTARAEGKRDGMISGVWMADLCEDGSAELVIAISSAGSGSYGSVHVYELHHGSCTVVAVRGLSDEDGAGYMGHDVFSVEGSRLYRSHPVYLQGDPNAAPSGGTVRLWYSFADREWVREP